MPRSARFAGAGLKGHLLQIVDPAEEDLPFDGRVRFEGVEERDEVVISRVETVRDDYAGRFREHREGLPAIAAALGWSFGSHRTDRPPHLALLALHAALSPTGGDDRPAAAPTLPSPARGPSLPRKRGRGTPQARRAPPALRGGSA